MHIRMDTSENETARYGPYGIIETVQYFKGTVNGTSLHYYLINFLVNSDV